MPELDGLRAIAISLVIFFHFCDSIGAPAGSIGAHLIQLSKIGWSGVDLFFVLSGFLISGILLDNRHSDRYFRTFYGRRVFRIVPLYICFLIICIVLIRVSTVNPTWAYLTFTQNFTMPITKSFDRYLDVTWSLAVEEQMYLLIPLTVWFCSRRTLAWICSFLIVASPIARLALQSMGPWRFVLTFLRLDAFAVGILLAIVIRDEALVAIMRTHKGALLMTFACLLAPLAWITMHPEAYRWLSLSFFAVFYGLCVLLAIFCKPRLLTNRIATTIGLSAYSLYLFHKLWLEAVQSVMGSTGKYSIAIAVIVTIIACWIVFYVFERPLIAFASRRFRYH